MEKICAYNELYFPLAQRALGDMYDFAVNTLGILLEEFQQMFLVSDVSRQVAKGNPSYVAGKNGCELARAVVLECTGEEPVQEDVMYLDKSPEYWIGWALAYYQWESGLSFTYIERLLPAKQMYALYPTLHEADVSQFSAIMDERLAAQQKGGTLRRLRSYAGMTQRELAEESGVPLRQIQLFEQGQRDPDKAQAATIEKLKKALGKSI